MKYILVFIAMLGGGCSGLPKQYSAAPNRCLVQAAATGNTRVGIYQVDDGEVIEMGRYHWAKKVWLEPGPHRIRVDSRTTLPWVTRRINGAVQVNVRTGYTYTITSDPVGGNRDDPPPKLTVTETPRK